MGAHTEDLPRLLADALRGALYVLDETIDGSGPTRTDAIRQAREALATWEREGTE